MSAEQERAGREQGEPFRLLFVCTGNTCRSPMAEAIARRAISERGWSHVEVRSAGIATGPGAPASAGAVRAARLHGLDLTGHESTPATPELLEWADVILTMTPSHLMHVLHFGVGDRAYLLPAFAAVGGGPGATLSVPDPFGGSDEEYVETLLLLERLIEAALERLTPIVAP